MLARAAVSASGVGLQEALLEVTLEQIDAKSPAAPSGDA